MASRHRGVQRGEARGEAAPPREVGGGARLEQPRQQGRGAVVGARVAERLSVGRAALVARQHSALAVAQPPLGEQLELVGGAVGVEPLEEGLEEGVIARLVRGRLRLRLRLGVGREGLGLG